MKYKVKISSKAYFVHYFEVEANSEDEAHELASYEASELDFSNWTLVDFECCEQVIFNDSDLH